AWYFVGAELESNMTQQETPPNPDHDRSKLGVILDASIHVKGSKKLQEYLNSRNDLGIKSAKNLTIPQIKSILSAINEDRKDGRESLSLSALLSDAEIILPSLVVPERDPHLDERVNRLRYELAEKEYKRMTKNVNLTSRFNPEDSIGSELKKMNTGLIAVFQFVVTVGAAFAFGFMGVEVFAGVTFELAVKLLLGIIFALVVGAAELYFLVLNMDFGDKVELIQEQKNKSYSISSPLKKTN
ncbi:unnamed protein product, partial [Allacma fusca]